jgi:putative redox protein
MPAQLSVRAVHQGGMRVRATAGSHQVLTDYPLEAGQAAEGFTSLELLLASLATCAANSVNLVLKRRMEQNVAGVAVEAVGIRRDEHPMGFTDIAMTFQVKGAALDPEAVAKAIQLSEERICPVWNMLKHGTRITSSFQVVD